MAGTFMDATKAEPYSPADSLDEKFNDLSGVIAEIEDMTSRACGSRPVQDSKGTLASVSAGRVGEWNRSVEGLIDRARDVRDTLRRTFG